MRLLFIGAVPPPQHGVSRMNAILLCAPPLRQRFEVRHLDLGDRRPISTVEKLDWINVWEALRNAARCSWQLATWKPDITYLGISQKALGFLRDATFLVPARLLGRKTVVHLHGGNFQEFYRHAGWLLRMLIRFALGRVHRAIVLGESLRPVLSGLVPAERIVVVPNGIPDFAADAPVPGTNSKLHVLYLGTLAREKGIEVFVEAALLALARTDAVEFVAAGPWFRTAERDAIFARLSSSVHSSAIQFVGEVSGPQVAEVLRRADVLVFPGLQQEGLPLVVLEAMCAGRPVIATDRGCLREVVVSGETGFLVAPGDSSAIAQHVLALAQDRAACARLGQAGRARYVARYGMEEFANRMLAALASE